MAMTTFNGDMEQSIKWLQQKAPKLLSLIDQKKTWYNQYHSQFWSQWETNVFDIKTANNFGLMIWCIILGVNAGDLGLYPNNASFAFGEERANFVDPSVPSQNIGGNFYGAGASVVGSLDEIRKVLQLRYVALVSRGNIAFINKMLRYIFNGGQPWNKAGGRWFYVADRNHATAPAPAFTLEYRIGPNMNFSPNIINLWNKQDRELLPRLMGTKAIAIQQ